MTKTNWPEGFEGVRWTLANLRHRPIFLLPIALCSLLTTAVAQTANTHYEAGERAINEARWVDAGRELEQAAQMDPDNQRYQAAFAEVRVEASRWAESAARIYLSVNNVQSAQLMLMQAVHFDKGNQAAATLLAAVNGKLAGRYAPAQAPPPEERMTNATLVEMAKLGLPADVITAKIRSVAANRFDTSMQALADLRAAGVPDAVLVYVVENYGKPRAAPKAALPTMDDAGSGRFRWAENEPGADQFLLLGIRYLSMTAHGITVSVSLSDTGSTMRADIGFFNGGASSVDVDPAQFSLLSQPEARSLRYQEPEALIASIKATASRRATRLVWSGLLARSTYTRQTDAAGSVSGVTVDSSGIGFQSATLNARATAVTTGPNYVAQMRANQLAEQLMAGAISDAEYIREIALKATTLFPGTRIAGAVWFEREKDCESATLTVPAGAYDFGFPLYCGQ